MSMSTSSEDEMAVPLPSHVNDVTGTGMTILTRLRENSALIAAFPWLSRLALIEGPLSFKFQDPRRRMLLPLANKVDQCFHAMDNAHDMSSTELKSLLNPDVARTAPFSSHTIIKLTPLLVALRVLDACMDCYPDEETTVVLKHSKTLITKKPKLWQKFAEWPKTLLKAKKALSALATLKDPSVAGWQQMSHFQSLMLFCVQTDAADQGVVFLRNVVIAAMDIAVMSGLIDDENDGSIPHVPDSAADFAATIAKYAARTNGFQEEHYLEISASNLISREGKQSKDTRYLGNPLIFATTFSPLALFLPYQLVTYYLNKSEIAMWTKRVGNCKLPVLQNTEREVWKALLDIASGTKTPLLALLDCFDRIDWDAVHNADCPNWFTDGFDNENAAVLQDVNDFNLASDVPGDWTNAQTFLDTVAKRAAAATEEVNNEADVTTQGDHAEPASEPTQPTMNDNVRQSSATPERNVQPIDTPLFDAARDPAPSGDINPSPGAQHQASVLQLNAPQGVDAASSSATNSNAQAVETPTSDAARGPAPIKSPGDQRQPLAIEVATPAHNPPENAVNMYPYGQLGQPPLQNAPQSGDADRQATSPSEDHSPAQPVKLGKRKKVQDLKISDLKSRRSVTVNRTSSLAQDIPAPDDLVESQVAHKKVEYIDIDDILSGRPDTDLDDVARPKKNKNKNRPSFTVYTARGEAKKVTPELHGQYQLDSVFALFAASTASYTKGKPNFLTSTAKSAFTIMTEEASKNADQKVLLNLLGPKILVLTESDVELTSFDENGLSELKDLGAVISVHDYSIPPKNGSYKDRSKKTTLETILKCSRDPKGKILNALDIPMGWKGAAPTPFSSETRAWMATEGLPYCKDDNLPANALRWALVTTKGAHHPWHIDANGSGAFLVAGCGGKLIFVGTPIDRQGLQRIDLYLDNFEPYGPCSNKWKIEAIYLEPGDKIILPPNTPHSVITTDHTICHGGHFFFSSTMTDTLVGIVHNFFCNALSTNTDHAEWRDLIHRMTVFYHDILVSRNPIRDRRTRLHAPQLTDLKSVLNLFSTCAISILMNALSVETYQSAEETAVDGQFLHSSHREMYDLNAMNGFTRAKCIHHRALAWEIIHHVDAWYVFKNRATNEGLSAFDDIFVPFISNLARAAIAYDQKVAAMDFKPSIIELPANAFQTQVRACFHNHAIILDAIDKCDDTTSLIFPFDFDCVVTPAPDLERISVVVTTSGETSRDILYESGRESGWRLWAEPSQSDQYFDMDEDEDDNNSEDDDDDNSDEYLPPAKRARTG